MGLKIIYLIFMMYIGLILFNYCTEIYCKRLHGHQDSDFVSFIQDVSVNVASLLLHSKI